MPRQRACSPRVTYDVSDRILAAVMPGPRRPIEIREFASPDLPHGAALLRTARSEVCGTDVHLWHGRLSGVPVSDHPRTRLRRHRSMRIRGPLRGLDGARPARGRSRRVLRRASHLRPLPRVHGPSHADAMQRAPRLRHHRSGRRRSVRRLVAGDLSRAGRRHRATARQRERSTITSAAAAAC